MIGAGPSGIVAGKILRADGFEVSIFEKQNQIGGIWSEHGCYAGLRTQVPAPLFEFADLPSHLDLAPAQAVQSYLERYAAKFGVLDRVRTGTQVVSVLPLPSPGIPGTAGWRIAYRPTAADQQNTKSEDFDFVVVASGAHSIPRIPDIPGRDAFLGEVLHSNQVREHHLAGSRVIIIGGGKSAVELAVHASRVSTTATLIQRRVNWMIPQKFFFGTVPYGWILFTRLGEALLPLYHDQAAVRPLDRLLTPMKRALWWLITKNAIHETGYCQLPSELRPQTPLPSGVAHAGIVSREYADAVRTGRLAVAVADVSEFHEYGIRLVDDKAAQGDLVIFATGHRKEFPFLDESIRVHDEAGRLSLYKGILPTDVQNLGFIGFRYVHNNLLGMEICAHWLSAKFRNRFQTSPSPQAMRSAVQSRLSWQEATFPGSEGYEFGPYSIHAADELLLELGIKVKRARNILAEYLTGVSASSRYADLAAELRHAKPRHGSTG